MVSFKLSWVGEVEAEKSLEFTIAPKIRVEELVADKKFKRTVALELKHKEEQLPLTLMLRDYVERLSDVHGAAQNETQESSQAALDIVSSALDRVKSKFGSDSVNPGIAVICQPDASDGNPDTRASLIPEFAERYRVLRGENKPIKNLSKRYVSGRAEQ